MKHCAALLIVLGCLASVATAQDTVQVSTGWNIIGSVSNGTVPQVLSTVPDSIIVSSFFGYAVGYQTADTLRRGHGYWVKVNQPGIIVFTTPPGDPNACGTMTVVYDGFTYHTVQIGSQCWLRENLNVGNMVTGVTNQADNAVIEKYCYNDDPAICGFIGGLYQWNEAMQYVATAGAQGICPSGWHIPTNAECTTLNTSVGGDGNALKAVGQGAGAGAGTNTSGFSALLAGFRNFSGSFGNVGYFTYVWSSTQSDASNANNLGVLNNDGAISQSIDYKGFGFSVRCIKD